ncbi:potassium uptake protein, TrkH family [Rhodothermus marinus SG0.5JP17-172]|jgi:trk system potassium uptake protein TrkH|uniref:TrkH family potassium uptake protein n=1 Tax=Rhodothermus marinus TaxID=29549 RepID=UPI000223DA4C|nr:TrkH family potassium uptake protein [Rhodothermus marinus]AEN74048.1 potassium uptake protein, TrkH family [Rhodothermus marinus SG0.5JP17-172]MBO2490975.1 TrkH family potassium uptake protein [Rhodothermus marinus]
MVLNLRALAATLGALLGFLAVALLLPAGIALSYGEPHWWPFVLSALLAGAVGGGLWVLGGRRPHEPGIREGFAIVALAWLVLSLFGALPFVLGDVLSYTDAFFETMSGFTTTGATILGGERTPEIEALPRAYLFWRSLAHWLGGMGIIVLTLAILPILGVGGMQLYKAEVPGPTADKLTPRVRETARRLWLIYVGITALEVLLLLPAMDWFDAVNHAFATMATGGFSTKNGSVGQFGSAYVEWVITVFMLLAGANFALHYRLLHGQWRPVWQDTELRVYLSIVAVATVLISLGIWAPLHAEGDYQTYAELTDALRHGAFQAVSIITTTGFGTADYEQWSPLAVGVLFLLFFVGGMAGSTGGGIKVVRHVLLFKNSFRELKQLVHPRAIVPVRLNGRMVSDEVLRNVLSFFVLYFGLLGMGTLALSAMEVDLLSAFGAVLSCLGNIGPTFGTMGPAENYAHLPALAKWILALLMMTGRLEIFTVLILLTRTFWRR